MNLESLKTEIPGTQDHCDPTSDLYREDIVWASEKGVLNTGTIPQVKEVLVGDNAG